MSISGKSSKSMVIVTPSYRPDAQLCQDLNASIMEFCSEEIEHHIIVPNQDIHLFEDLTSNRTKIISVESQLPGHIVKIPAVNMWLNVARPYPPLRGWIAQQLVKLGYVASLETDLALIIDSDIVFISKISVDDFAPGGQAPLFRRDGAVTAAMERHVTWHRVSHQLLGIDVPGECPLPDYITCPCLWEPHLVRGLLRRVSEVSGQHWATAVGKNVHFSEMILYGIYVEHISSSGKEFLTTDSSQVHNYWDEVPLDAEGLAGFLEGVTDEHLAVMISARSNTPSEVRRQAFGRLGR